MKGTVLTTIAGAIGAAMKTAIDHGTATTLATAKGMATSHEISAGKFPHAVQKCLTNLPDRPDPPRLNAQETMVALARTDPLQHRKHSRVATLRHRQTPPR
jgi:hypothetical protein